MKGGKHVLDHCAVDNHLDTVQGRLAAVHYLQESDQRRVDKWILRLIILSLFVNVPLLIFSVSLWLK